MRFVLFLNGDSQDFRLQGLLSYIQDYGLRDCAFGDYDCHRYPRATTRIQTDQNPGFGLKRAIFRCLAFRSKRQIQVVLGFELVAAATRS